VCDRRRRSAVSCRSVRCERRRHGSETWQSPCARRGPMPRARVCRERAPSCSDSQPVPLRFVASPYGARAASVERLRRRRTAAHSASLLAIHIACAQQAVQSGSCTPATNGRASCTCSLWRARAHPVLNPAAVEDAWCERAGYAVDPVGRLPGRFVSRRRVRRLSGAEFVAQLVTSGAA
jgi:hypothetical protein